MLEHYFNGLKIPETADDGLNGIPLPAVSSAFLPCIQILIETERKKMLTLWIPPSKYHHKTETCGGIIHETGRQDVKTLMKM
jgi:hypothetical protein